jgi:hypothetical protein
MFETSADSIAPSTGNDALAADAPEPVTDPAVTSEIITLRAKLNLAPDVAIDCADIAEEAPETASKAALVPIDCADIAEEAPETASKAALVPIDCADIAEEAPETASKAALVAMLGAERATAAAFTTESASDIAPACTAELIAAVIAAETPILLPATLIAEETEPAATA